MDATLAETVTEALACAALTDQDRAAAELALRYAAGIDEGGDLAKLGAGLLAALESLGMTPKSRRAARSDAPAATGNPLDELRQRRQQRGQRTG